MYKLVPMSGKSFVINCYATEKYFSYRDRGRRCNIVTKPIEFLVDRNVIFFFHWRVHSFPRRRPVGVARSFVSAVLWL